MNKTVLIKRSRISHINSAGNMSSSFPFGSISYDALSLTIEQDVFDLSVGSVIMFSYTFLGSSWALGSGSMPTIEKNTFYGLVLQTSPYFTIKDLKTNKIYDEYEIQKPAAGYLNYKKQ